MPCFAAVRAPRLAAFAIPLALVLPLGPPANADELTVVSWGGAYTKSQMLAFIQPYRQNTGAELDVIDYAGGLEQIRAQVRSLNVKWDVVDLELADAIRGCEQGLLEKIDPALLPAAPDGTPARDDFIDGSLQECAVGSVVWSTVLAYDTRSTGARAPRRVEDFFDVDTFPGRRGMRRTPKGNLEWALLADGVSAERIYTVLETPEGLERAFAVLDRIKPHVVWWEDGAQPPRMLETGRVVMTSSYSGRIYEANVNRGQELGIVWDHQIWNIDLWAIPRGSPDRERALEFIKFATATEQLAEQAKHIPYGPVRQSALARVPAHTRPHLPTETHNFATALQINARWWAEHFEHIDRQFEEWMHRPVRVPQALPR